MDTLNNQALANRKLLSTPAVRWPVALAAAAAFLGATLAPAPASAQDAQGISLGTGCTYPVNVVNQGGGARSGPVTLIPLLWQWQDNSGTVVNELEAFYSQLEASNYYKWIQLEYGAPQLTHFSVVTGGPGTTAPPATAAAPVLIQDATIQSFLQDANRNGVYGNPANPVYSSTCRPTSRSRLASA